MSYNFKNLSEVEFIDSVPDGATVFAEVNGAVKRIPGDGLGGSGKNLIIVSSEFANAIASGVQTMGVPGPPVTYSANMSFEDALTAYRSCELTGTVAYITTDFPVCVGCTVIDFSAIAQVDCLCIMIF